MPDEPIAEFNHVSFRPGAKRGNHLHPEFTEYLLVTGGHGALLWRKERDGPDRVISMSAGMCARVPAETVHAFHAITEVTAVAMITKRWDACDVPYVRVEPTG